MSWIKGQYPIGSKVNTVNMQTGLPEPAEVVNHMLGSGFQARHTTGIIVRFEDGAVESAEAAFLAEDGSDRIS